METSRLTQEKIQSSVISQKGNVDGLIGQRFHSDDGVKAAVLHWFHDQPTSFFVDGIRNLPQQRDACLNKEYAAFISRRESIKSESPTSFPEDTTMPYLGFEPTRLLAESHIHRTDWAATID
ncbi:hypothetical protein TNCV_316591 [Trichonephila clavipes]|nr:hypothetical protein TNCV_316591 [Trichonephila clavipes]